MNRLAIVTVAGLCSLAPVKAQESTLAPTAPVVPSPVIQDGKLLNSPGGRVLGTKASRVFPAPRWSSSRDELATTITQPVAPKANYAYPPMPAPPMAGDPNSCGPAGCGRTRRGSYWEHLKAWLTYHPSNTELPRCRPTPYVTPLLGMFPCTSAGGDYGCANGSVGYGPSPAGLPPAGYPLGQPQMMQPPMPQPMPPGSGAGPVMMPSRGVQGTALTPTWQGRTPAPATPGFSGYRYASPDSLNGAKTGPVVNASGKIPW